MNSVRRKTRTGMIPGLVVAAVIVALAGRAEATTTVSGSTVNKTNTATIWKQNKTGAGTFGAGFSTGYTECNSGSSGCSGSTTQYVSGYGTFNAELFGSGEFQVGEIKADGSPNGATYDIYAGTAHVISEPASAFNAQTLSATYSQSVFEVNYQTTIGPIPVIASFSLEADLSISISGSLSSNYIDWIATPAVSDTISGSVGVGGKAFSVGVEVSCDIEQVSFPFTLSLTYYPSVPQVSYAITVQDQTTFLDGSISLYAKALFLEYTYKLFSWNGFSKTDTLFTDDAPSASVPSIDLSAGYQATGNYNYSDASGYSENGSKYDWIVCLASDVSNCSGSNLVDLNQNTDNLSLNYVWPSGNQYLEFCVTPKNGYNYGPQSCSPWTYVGPLAVFSHSGTNGATYLSFAPQSDQVSSGTCFNMTSSFNDTAANVYLYNGNTSALLMMYSDYNCAGTELSSSVVSANGSWSQSLSGTTMSGALSSFKLIYNDTPSADVQLNLVPEPGAWYAYLNYTFTSTSSLSESGSTYTLQVATDSSGSGATTVASGSITASSGVVSTSPNYDAIPQGDYVDFCVTPSDGFMTGSQSCSGWTATSTRVAWYSGESQTGSWLPLSVANGACQDIASVTKSYVGTPKSLALNAPSTGTATIYMYTGSGCSGTTYSRSAGAGTTHDINLDSVGIGSNIASYQITW